tara:strand:+ start:144 stop:344 length:201 start_codon:yes stop_codon:yes gene_type:complete
MKSRTEALEHAFVDAAASFRLHYGANFVEPLRVTPFASESGFGSDVPTRALSVYDGGTQLQQETNP